MEGGVGVFGVFGLYPRFLLFPTVSPWIRFLDPEAAFPRQNVVLGGVTGNGVNDTYESLH